MKKAVKIILGVAGGYVVLNVVSIMSLYVSGITLKQYFPKETSLMAYDISTLNNDSSVPAGDKLLLRWIQNGIKIGK